MDSGNPADTGHKRNPRLGPFAALWLATILFGTWLLYAVPAALALAFAVNVPLASGTLLAVASVGPGAGTFLLSAGLAVAAVSALLMVLVARAVLPRDRAPAVPVRAALSVGALLVIALPMEWCLGDAVPDLFSVAPLVIVAAVAGIVMPIVLLWATAKAALGLNRASHDRPFLGGVVATLGTALLVPPALAVFSFALLVQTVHAGLDPPPPGASGDMHVVAGEPDAWGVKANAIAASSAGGPEAAGAGYDTEACLQELARIRSQVERMLQAQYTVSPADAEDIASDAMISVCVSESLSSYRNLRAVYRKAAQNRATDVLRKRKGEVGVEAALCLPVYPDDWRLPSEMVIAHAALGQLDNRTQDALRLWSLSEPHSAIALQLGITERQSRDLVGNGMKSMRRFVSKRCFRPDPK